MAYPPFAYMEPAIAQGESGGDWNALYNFQNRAGGLFGDVNVSDMTINEVLDFQRTGSPYATYVTDILGYKSTPVGRYQIVGDTLEWAKGKLGLTGEEKFDPETQRQIAEYIYNTQGPSAWEALKGTQMADQMTPQQMAPQQAAGYQQFGPENLSRSQRTMLGFAALRDAAAALRGNQTSFFSDAYSGLEQRHRYGQELAFRQAQEQRLLEENMTNRRNVALQTLGQIQARDREARKIAEITGQPYTPNPADQQLAAMLMSQLEGFGSPMPAATTAGGAAPADGGAAPAAGLDAAKAAAPVAMNLPMAQDIIMSGDANEEQLTAAVKFLQRPDVAGLAGDTSDLIDRAFQRLDKLQTPESTSRVTSANTVINHLDHISEMVIENPSIVGGKGAFIRTLPEWVQANISGDTVELSGLIRTVEADIAFSRLQQMRDESKTGGALGNVSDRELGYLKASLAELNPNMKPEAFLRQLDIVKGHYKNIIDKAFASTEDRARLVAVLGYDPQAAPVTSGSASGIGWSVAE